MVTTYCMYKNCDSCAPMLIWAPDFDMTMHASCTVVSTGDSRMLQAYFPPWCVCKNYVFLINDMFEMMGYWKCFNLTIKY